MTHGWWILPGAITGAAAYGAVVYQFGFESSLWIAGAVAVLLVLWLVGAKTASALGLVMVISLLTRRERKAAHERRDAELARDALRNIDRGHRARADVDLSDDKLRDDDGYRRD